MLRPDRHTTDIQEHKAKWRTWRFLFVNDLHYTTPECRPWFDQVVAAMKASAPDAKFCLVGGDLTENGTVDQMKSIRDALDGLGIPVHATAGNHDYLSANDCCVYDAVWGFPNRQFTYRSWQFLGLDTTDGNRYQNTLISPETLALLDEVVPELSPTKRTVVWTHFPLGEGVPYRPLNADALLERLAPLNIQAILSGHWHAFTQTQWCDAILTTNRCCSRLNQNFDGSKEKGWFVCTVEDDELSIHFVEIPMIG